MTLLPDATPKRRKSGPSGPSGKHRRPTEEEQAQYLRLARRLVPGTAGPAAPLTVPEVAEVASILGVYPGLIRRALSGVRAVGSATFERWRRLVYSRDLRTRHAYYRTLPKRVAQ